MADFPVPFNDRLISYTAVGGETAHDFDFPVFAQTDIAVIRIRSGTVTTLTLTTHYTVTLNTDQEADPGGTVTLVTGATAADVHVIVGATVVERTTDFAQRGAWTAEDINEQFDRLIMMLQEMKRVGLAWDAQTTATIGAVPYDIAANQFIRRNSGNTDWEAVTVATSGTTVVSANETTEGILEIATNAEALAMAATNKALVPSNLAALFAASQTWTAAQSIQISAAGTALTLISTDADAASGPDLNLYRNSASPAANDVISAVNFQGEDSAGNTETYARLRAIIIDPTSTSEDAEVRLDTVVAGTITEQKRWPTPCFFAHKNGSNQTGITSGAAVAVTFGTETFDVGGFFASDAYTPLAGGKYNVTAAAVFTTANAVDNESLILLIYKNGGEFLRESRTRAGTANECGLSITAVISMNGTTDVLTVRAFKGGAGDGTLDGSATKTFFCAHMI